MKRNSYPQPYDEPRWHSSELEDYEALRDDDTRRRFLLLIGYDEAHKADVVRLFGGVDARDSRRNKLERYKSKLEKDKIKRWVLENGGFIALFSLLVSLAGLVIAILK